MRTTTAFALALSLATVSTAAFAQDDSATCATAGKQVTAALAGNDNDAARKERKIGLEFCNAGYYRQGMAHYARALELLGQKS
jgi:hypothetical protein